MDVYRRDFGSFVPLEPADYAADDFLERLRNVILPENDSGEIWSGRRIKDFVVETVWIVDWEEK